MDPLDALTQEELIEAVREAVWALRERGHQLEKRKNRQRVARNILILAMGLEEVLPQYLDEDHT